MNWKLSMLGLALLAFQPEPPAAKPAHAEDPVAVESGSVPMQGVWYQDSVGHYHDSEVKLTRTYSKKGVLAVEVATEHPSGTDLVFFFSHDEKSATHVRVTGKFRGDALTPDSQPVKNLSAINGRVMLRSNDWGPGKDFTCVFALRGKAGDAPQFLLGSFLVMIPE